MQVSHMLSKSDDGGLTLSINSVLLVSLMVPVLVYQAPAGEKKSAKYQEG